MRVEKTVCNNCKKEVTDHYDGPGWITIEVGTFAVAGGRNKSGPEKGIPNTLQFYAGSGRNMDFCSRACFNQYFLTLGRPTSDKAIKARKEKKK